MKAIEIAKLERCLDEDEQYILSQAVLDARQTIDRALDSMSWSRVENFENVINRERIDETRKYLKDWLSKYSDPKQVPGQPAHNKDDVDALLFALESCAQQMLCISRASNIELAHTMAGCWLNKYAPPFNIVDQEKK